MTNISDILKPYEDSQPKPIKTTPYIHSIQRIPPLVTESGFNPKFQKFYDDIVKAIREQDFKLLYNISDKVLTEDEFVKLIAVKWGAVIVKKFLTNSQFGKLDIELNLQRFEDIYRNIVGGINIMIYQLHVDDDAFHLDRKTTSLKQSHTEILFTFRNEEFELISTFEPFTERE